MYLTSIISVNYNQEGVTVDFLKSVKKFTANDKVEVILIDNGSDKDHGEMFKQILPNLIYIRSETNLGFAGGNNLGIKVAKGDFLLLLNNDTELSEGLIDTLVDEFKQNTEIGIISPLILYFDDKRKVQYAGFTKMNYYTGRNQAVWKDQGDIDKIRTVSCETGFIHGAAMMCKSEDLKNIGLMDEKYFLYYEELDWCEKFRRAEKKIWFTGKTMIYHKESISVGKNSSLKTFFMHRNRMLYVRKNASSLVSFIFLTYYITVVCPKSIIKFLIKGETKNIKWVLKAVLWNVTESTDSAFLGYKI